MLDVREQKVEGWESIAKAIGVDERTARRYAKLRKDPLPVYWRRRGGLVVAHATALRDWIARQEIPLDMRGSYQD
jgi:hypothetical protein